MENARQNGVNLVSHQDCDTGTCKSKRARRKEAIQHARALSPGYYGGIGNREDGTGETVASDFMARSQAAIPPAWQVQAGLTVQLDRLNLGGESALSFIISSGGWPP